MTYAQNYVKSSSLKTTGIFVILLSQDGFESDYPEKVSSKVSSEAAVTGKQQENICVLQQENICVGVCFQGEKETPTQMPPCEYCEIFKSSFFIEHLRWLLLSA